MSKKIAIELSTGKKFLIKDSSSEFHTASGILFPKDIQKGGRIKSSKGEYFSIIEPQFADLWEMFARGPQVMIHKDIGIIITKTGLHKNSIVVDAGGGSGSLCLTLANICKCVTVYEINPEHYDVIAKNMKLLQFENLTLKHQDIYKGIDEIDLDLITLDLPEPWKALPHAVKSLKEGGHLVVYLPNLTQTQEFVKSIKNSKITFIEMIELIERKWKIEDKILRPEFQMLGHTGFLIFCRKW